MCGTQKEGAANAATIPRQVPILGFTASHQRDPRGIPGGEPPQAPPPPRGGRRQRRPEVSIQGDATRPDAGDSSCDRTG